MNCWEFKKCGREQGGINEEQKGQCPAYPEHGKHCARVSGTLCDGVAQGSFAMKLANCMKCDYYQSAHYDKTYNKSM